MWKKKKTDEQNEVGTHKIPNHDVMQSNSGWSEFNFLANHLNEANLTLLNIADV